MTPLNPKALRDAPPSMPWDATPWERALLWKVAHEVRCWQDGTAPTAEVALRNIAAFLSIPVRPEEP